MPMNNNKKKTRLPATNCMQKHTQTHVCAYTEPHSHTCTTHHRIQNQEDAFIILTCATVEF